MVETFKTLAQQTVPSTGATIYTTPALTQTIIKEILVANDSAGDSGVTISVNGFVILPMTTILAGGHGTFTGGITLNAGETVEADGSGNNVITISLFGVEEE